MEFLSKFKFQLYFFFPDARKIVDNLNIIDYDVTQNFQLLRKYLSSQEISTFLSTQIDHFKNQQPVNHLKIGYSWSNKPTAAVAGQKDKIM